MKKGKNRSSVLLMAVVFLSGLLSPASILNAQTIKPVTVESSLTFDETLSAIQKSVSGAGMMVLSELNQGKILSMTGMKINAHSFFIGNPNVGKNAFTADPSVGLVIPVRVNVFEQNGKTYINYFKPTDLFASFRSDKVKMIGEKLDGKLEMMLNKISK